MTKTVSPWISGAGSAVTVVTTVTSSPARKPTACAVTAYSVTVSRTMASESPCKQGGLALVTVVTLDSGRSQFTSWRMPARKLATVSFGGIEPTNKGFADLDPFTPNVPDSTAL